MKIQLTDWKIVNMTFALLKEENKREENNFNLESANYFAEEDDDNDKAFGVAFSIEVKDKLFDLNLEAVFNFETDEVISEAFKLSAFPKINAPAIGFPYLRAFISNVTLQSGFEPVILPSINFVKLSEEKESKIEE